MGYCKIKNINKFEKPLQRYLVNYLQGAANWTVLTEKNLFLDEKNWPRCLEIDFYETAMIAEYFIAISMVPEIQGVIFGHF